MSKDDTDTPLAEPADNTPTVSYRLDENVGFILRKASQRHTSIFSERMGHKLTATQFAAFAKLCEHGAVSQNRLGRLTAMDAATIKGVIDRLREKGIADTRPDPGDRRRLMVELTDHGQQITDEVLQAATQITEDTLAPLSAAERRAFLASLDKIS